jgi:hypothetical protein
MKTVVYTFQPQTPEDDHDRLCAEISGLPGVHKVGRLKPDAKTPALRRMWYANVASDAAASDLVTRLKGRREVIESAGRAADRAGPNPIKNFNPRDA